MLKNKGESLRGRQQRHSHNIVSQCAVIEGDPLVNKTCMHVIIEPEAVSELKQVLEKSELLWFERVPSCCLSPVGHVDDPAYTHLDEKQVPYSSRSTLLFWVYGSRFHE